ncbi:helix-turn-helix transcriptional regulator [Streptomyces sp. NBC_00846]|uniref:helix-turn-helix domain-containing protein n=1 Tax=Streptomyces sp. NBC_00846 TaxID=2975849 RepID=UPI00386ACB0C|nr:helix-turn-helix transcriptional regulator [Streptomyces sp. NBC_00846]
MPSRPGVPRSGCPRRSSPSWPRTTQAQVSRIERGAITPTLPVLERLARALDADLEVTLKAL